MLKKHIAQLINIGWIALMVSLPISKAVSSVALTALVILGIMVNFTQIKTKQNFNDKPIWALCSLYIAYIIGCFYSADTIQAFWFLYRANGLWLSPLAVLLHLPLIIEKHKFYLKVFIFGNLLACTSTLLLYTMPEARVIYLIEQLNGILSPYTSTVDRLSFGLYSPFIDRLQFGNLIGIGILAVIWLWGETINKKQNFYAISSLTILIITHLFLGARAAQLGSLVSVALLALVALAQTVYKKLKGIVSKPVVVAITTIFVLSITLLLPYLSYHFVEPVKVRYEQLRWEIDMVLNHDFKAASYEHFTSLRRIISWKNLWELIEQYPLMGVGTGDYNAELDKIYAADSLHLSRNSHSQYLQIWATVGIWGLLVFLGSLIYWLYALSRQANRWLFSFGGAVLLFYSIVFLFDAVLLRQVDNMAFPLILSIIYTISYRQQKAKS